MLLRLLNCALALSSGNWDFWLCPFPVSASWLPLCLRSRTSTCDPRPHPGPGVLCGSPRGLLFSLQSQVAVRRPLQNPRSGHTHVLERRKETRNARLPTSFPCREKQTKRVFCPSDRAHVLWRLMCVAPVWATCPAATQDATGHSAHQKPATRAVAVKSGGRVVFLQLTTLHF